MQLKYKCMPQVVSREMKGAAHRWLVRLWGPPVMVVTTMWQVPGGAVPPFAGLPGDARMPLNLPSTASAYF